MTVKTPHDVAREAIALSLLDAGLAATEELALEVVDLVLADPGLDEARQPRPVVVPTDAEPRPLTAVRTLRATGRAHLHAAGACSGAEQTACGLLLSDVELVPWLSTAPQDRCTRCVEVDAAR